MRVVRTFSGAFLAGLTAVAAFSAEDSRPEDYRRMQGWRAAQPAVGVPVGGLTFSRDVATWRLESGSLRPFEPLGDGFVSGFVFEGAGRFRMEIPDAFEIAQFWRFSRKVGSATIDEPFTRLVLHTTSDLAGRLAPAPEGARFEGSALLKERSEEWLRRLSMDVDARVLAGHLTPGEDYLLVDMDTSSFGWLSFEFDPASPEEVTLSKLQSLNDWLEVWVSLDRASERDGAGRPASTSKPAIDVTLAQVQVDLRKHKGSAFDEEYGAERDKGFYVATVAFLPLVDGARAVRLYLSPLAKVTRVAIPDGQDLRYVRDHVGGRFTSVDNELYDGQLTVFFDEPLPIRKMQQVRVDYEMKQYNYASGRSWYPGSGGGLGDAHQAKVTFKLPKKMQVRCVGVKEGETLEGDTLVSTWSTAAPAKMIGYSFGKGFKEERIKQEGVPEVVAFGTSSGVVTGNMVRNVAVDVSNALRFYQWYFGVTLPFQEMQATCISGYHGQAFDGFLHLSQTTFDSEHPGASELFRAHEVAHAIWGHLVGWKGYRDQWLSESFAEYSALLFIETTMPKDNWTDEILQVYTNEQTGSLKSAMSKFARPWNVGLSSDLLGEMGPISAGWRASTARMPGAYEIQAYDKGALVLHMLRAVLTGMARDRDLFREVMQEFLRTYSGKEASTDDFRRIIEAKTKASWKGFFDTWVHGTVIPDITWSQSVAAGPYGKPVITLKVDVAGTAPDFAQPVPVQVVLSGERTGTLYVPVRAPQTTHSVELPETPKRVVFAPRHSLLARIKEK